MAADPVSVQVGTDAHQQVAWPFAAGIVRLGVMLVAGVYWVTNLHGSLNGLYWIVAASYLVFGSINAFALASDLGWGERLARRKMLEPAR